jgi:hypothetical protein
MPTAYLRSLSCGLALILAIGCGSKTSSGSGSSAAGAGTTGQAGSAAISGSAGSAAISGSAGSAGGAGVLAQAGTGAAGQPAAGSGVAGAAAPAPCEGYDAATTLTNCFVGACQDAIRNNTEVSSCVSACFTAAGAPAACAPCAGEAAATTRAVNCMSLCDSGAPGCVSCMTGQDFASNLPTCGVTESDQTYTQKSGPCGAPEEQKKIANLSPINMICTTQHCNNDFLFGDPTACMTTCYKDLYMFGDTCTACLGEKTPAAKTACTGMCIGSAGGCLPCIYGELDKTQPQCVGN